MQNATIFSRQSILKIAVEEIVQNAIISVLRESYIAQAVSKLVSFGSHI